MQSDAGGDELPRKDPPTTAPAGAEGGPARATRRRRAARAARAATLRLAAALVWVSGAAVLVVLVTLPAILALEGRTLAAPGWLARAAEARADALLPGLDVTFAGIDLVVERDGFVRVALSDVTLLTDAGAPVAELARAEAAFTPGALLRREVELREITATGAELTVSRDADGRFALRLGGGDGPPPALPDVLARIDAALADPRLAALDRVEIADLTLDYQDARAGRDWRAEGGAIRVRRSQDALALSAALTLTTPGGAAARLALDAESDIGATDLSFGISVADLPARELAAQAPALAWLGALDAPISGALRGYLDPRGDLAGLDATLQIAAGALQPSPEAQPIAFERATTYFSYDPASESLNFTEIALVSDLLRATAEGRVSLRGLARPARSAPEFVGQFTLRNVETRVAGLFDTPVSIGRAQADIKLALAPFALDLGRFQVLDPDFPFAASGRFSVAEDGWHVAVDGTLDETTPGFVEAHWPERTLPGTRRWFVDNVAGGRVEDAVLAVRATQGHAPDLHLDFRFVDAEVQVLRSMPPIETATGQFTLSDGRLGIAVERGRMIPPEGGALDVAGSTFTILDTRARPATGVLGLDAAGRATAVLSLLDSPPLRVMERAGRPVDLISAEARATGRIALPLAPGNTLADIDLDVTGTLRDVESSRLVPGRAFAADTLEVRVGTAGISVGGTGSLAGVPFTGTWRQPLGADAGPGGIDGTVTLSPAAARNFGIALPEGLLSGSGPADLRVDFRDGAPPTFALSSRLDGIGLAVPALGWRLARGTPGRFEIAGALGAPARIDRLEISGAGLSASGALSLRPGGGLERLRFDDARLSDWFRGRVTLTGRGAGQAPAIAVSNATLDLRRATFGQGGGGGGGGGGSIPIDVQLDQLTISEGIVLRDFRADIATRPGGLSGRFRSGMRGSDVRLTGELVPQAGGTAIRIASDNAGAVLAAAGLLQTVDDGALALDLAPVAGARGTYDGALSITDARLRDAPAIGALLDAVSIVGIIDQLEGPGIYFEDVDALFRLTPERLVLRQSSATGPSMGISLDGYVNLAQRTLDLQGVFSPIYVLNSIGSFLTRRGEGLLGFSFTIGGSTARPRVAVNPLSVFTPGMFREIFRRPPPDLGN